MFALLAATLIWSFSFGIIKQVLVGVPGEWVAFLRLALAVSFFLPVAARLGRSGPRVRLAAIGGVQFGLMYIFYLKSYVWLAAWEVALFTAFTPIWVLLLEAGWRKGAARIAGIAWPAVAVCVAGAWLIRADGAKLPAFSEGFLWIQAANLCFAFGQVAYRRLLAGQSDVHDASAHAWMFLGGTLVAGAFAAVRFTGGFLTDPAGTMDLLRLDLQQIAAIVYLGLVAAGFGFLLWNAGARRVSAGVLATMNNLKVPGGVLVSVIFFGEALSATGSGSEIARKLIGIALVLGAVMVAGRAARGAVQGTS